ncbi:MAG: FAD-dependent oxidoreductase, partial [Nocardioides sp.]
MDRTHLAVVGSGVAGLTAAYVASRTADVTLFEADDRLGGHADTHLVPEARDGQSRVLAIDTGFIVHNPRTYPVLLRMFAELGVATQESEMSMSIRDDGSGLEWAGALGRKGVFPSIDAVRRPRYLLMLAEIPRFHRRAKALVSTSSTTENDTTLREFLAAGHFSAYFTRHFMEPMVAAVWSCDPDVALDYPARYLFTFLQHHGMLGIFGSPQWRTVTGGSHEYVRQVAAELGEIRTGSKVTSVQETPDGVEITDGNGEVTTYDAVVIATHPSHALTMLAAPSVAQREVLSALPYSANTALLHTDVSLLPRTRNAWASWNFRRPAAEGRGREEGGGLRRARVGPERSEESTDPSRNQGPAAEGRGAEDAAGDGPVLVTYDLTRLQRLETDTHYLVTLGGEHLVDPATVIDRMEYEHPLYNP